jgi:outer membrane biosynthesis protein TonB
MTLTTAYNDYLNLVELQKIKSTKRGAVELRKFLMTIKNECDTERKNLLSSKTPEPVQPEPVQEPEPEAVQPEPVQEPEPVPEMLPLVREMTVGISSSQPVKKVEIKKKRKTNKA